MIIIIYTFRNLYKHPDNLSENLKNCCSEKLGFIENIMVSSVLKQQLQLIIGILLGRILLNNIPSNFIIKSDTNSDKIFLVTVYINIFLAIIHYSYTKDLDLNNLKKRLIKYTKEAKQNKKAISNKLSKLKANPMPSVSRRLYG